MESVIKGLKINHVFFSSSLSFSVSPLRPPFVRTQIEFFLSGQIPRSVWKHGLLDCDAATLCLTSS